MEIDEQIKNRLKRAIEEEVFPGAVVGFLANDEVKIVSTGKYTYEVDSNKIENESIFDLASVTKSIPTNSLALKLIDEGKLSQEDRLIDYIPEYNSQYREEVKIKHLLTYSIVLDIQAPLSSHINDDPEAIIKLIMNAPLQERPGKKFLYTNTPSILLGMVMEKIYGKPLDVIAEEVFFRPLGMNKTTFHPNKLTVPTEVDEKRGVVQGFVHDEVTWALQKKMIPGCAGVFSTAADLMKFARAMLNGKIFSREMMIKIATNQLAEIGVSYGLGWELNQPRFMGRGQSEKVIGKTGFTGTMILMNLANKKAMTLLTNHTFPKRRPDPREINEIRADIAGMLLY